MIYLNYIYLDFINKLIDYSSIFFKSNNDRYYNEKNQNLNGNKFKYRIPAICNINFSFLIYIYTKK